MIRVINKIGRPRSGSPICLITRIITDRIGQHQVLLPINHNHYIHYNFLEQVNMIKNTVGHHGGKLAD